jgi:hypothetical protein
MRLAAGAIAFGTFDENNQVVWTNGLSKDGLSASHITSGTIDTAKIQIMNGTKPTFKWDY